MKATLAFAALLIPGVALAECRPDTVELRGDAGTARFTVEIADDAAERARGLMHRESMPRSAGMLFIYEQPQSVSFWMENTLIPLDMVFLDRTGTVRHVHENAVPLDRTAIPGGDDILAVLEINGGLSARMGIVPGTQMRHPAFAEAAAWPCAE
ncbi:DUF192 domain-containing protein [Cereibacter sp. SYSU M97828]|nr:DUF192 domain-containing protein [Cereibacter flavus]